MKHSIFGGGDNKGFRLARNQSPVANICELHFQNKTYFKGHFLFSHTGSFGIMYEGNRQEMMHVI